MWPQNVKSKFDWSLIYFKGAYANVYNIPDTMTTLKATTHLIKSFLR
jgi:hypothetical protein